VRFFEKICSKRDAVDAGAEWTSHASGIANLFGTSYHTAIAHDLSKNRAKSEATRQPDTEIIFEIFNKFLQNTDLALSFTSARTTTWTCV